MGSPSTIRATGHRWSPPPDLGPASDRVDGLVAAPPEGDFRVNLLVGVAPLPPSIDNEAFAAGAIRSLPASLGLKRWIEERSRSMGRLLSGWTTRLFFALRPSFSVRSISRATSMAW